jgi:outer membrane lipoprotein-sorting protein
MALPRLIVCVLLLAGAPTLAAPPSADWEEIRKAASNIKSIETAFVQTKTLKILAKPLVSRGVMAFRRPNDLRWEYQSPLQTLLVAHGGNVQRFIKHGDVWVEDSTAKLEAMKIVLGEINQWLNGDFTSSKTFRPELRKAPGSGAAQVDLLPVDPSLARIISRIAISFAERPGTVSAIDIYEGNAGVTHIAFENSRYDGAIPDQRFEAPR